MSKVGQPINTGQLIWNKWPRKLTKTFDFVAENLDIY